MKKIQLAQKHGQDHNQPIHNEMSSYLKDWMRDRSAKTNFGSIS